ncbi:creatininase family protein [Falsiroseomonas sp. HW251]|uniref:creatininase family protein n=1 Tax=Falsiroseomonas sp. HW251 TaxID=3390998 RepID=UPI003D314BCE
MRGRRAAIGIGLGAVATGGAALLLAPRPAATPLPETLELADMTWPEVRAAIEAGWRTVIVPSGGIEQNGPHMILSKHDHIVRHAAQRIARALGRTLVAPVISFVPQGDWDPPSNNMRFPGTIGVTPAVFEGLLDGIARSLKSAGFTAICLIADHGESQAPQQAVATRLDAAWRARGTRVLSVASFYTAADRQEAWLRERGETAATIGGHAGIMDTSELMAVQPRGVDLSRLEGRRGSALAPLGATGDPSRASAERGEAILPLRIDAAVAEIRAALTGRT